MPNRHHAADLQVRNATDVGRGDGAGLQLRRWPSLRSRNGYAKLGLQYRIGAGGAAAKMRLALRYLHVEAERTQVDFDPTAELLAVLKAAGRVAGHHSAGAFARFFSVGTKSGCSSSSSRVSSPMRFALRAGRVVAQNGACAKLPASCFAGTLAFWASGSRPRTD